MRTIARAAFCFVMLFLLQSAPAVADGAVPGWNKFVYLIYRLEVTRYCGLATDQVGAGFRAQRDAMLAQYRFSDALIQSARGEADKLAYREWDNRGLGGFRRWCKQDAARYARQFLRARGEHGKHDGDD